MEKFSPEDQEFITSVYRQLKSNPKKFTLTASEHTRIIRFLDYEAFDIIHYVEVEYYGYGIGVFLVKEDLSSNIPGEESRVVKEVLQSELFNKSIKILMAIRGGNLTSEIAVNAAYLHMGIAHKIIPNAFEVYNRSHICSETYVAVLKREKEDGIVRN